MTSPVECVVCMEPLIHAAATQCTKPYNPHGHAPCVCWTCMQRHVATNNTCPLCRSVMDTLYKVQPGASLCDSVEILSIRRPPTTTGRTRGHQFGTCASCHRQLLYRAEQPARDVACPNPIHMLNAAWFENGVHISMPTLDRRRSATYVNSSDAHAALFRVLQPHDQLLARFDLMNQVKGKWKQFIAENVTPAWWTRLLFADTSVVVFTRRYPSRALLIPRFMQQFDVTDDLVFGYLFSACTLDVSPLLPSTDTNKCDK